MGFHGPVVNNEKLHDSILRSLEGIHGDIFEFGVYDGGTTRQLAKHGRAVWAFDTYQGIPKEEFSRDNGDHDLPGKFKSSAPPEVLFEGYPNVIPVVGRFVDTLETIDPCTKAAFVYMDCDLYESYKQVLEWLPGHLVPGAVIHVDDYQTCAGCRKAVDEWVSKVGLEFKDNQIHWHGS